MDDPLITLTQLFNNTIGLITGLFPRWFIILLKSASAAISIALFTGIILLIIKLNILEDKAEKFHDFMGMPNISRRKSVKAWQQILRRFQKGDEAQIKIAIIEADKILSEILKQMGYHGETVADQLKLLTPAQLSNIEEIWHAHKIRNKIVHEPDFKLNNFEAQAIIDIYHQSFKELNLIE